MENVMKKLLILAGFLLVSLNTQAILLSSLLNGQTIVAGDKLFDQWDVLFESTSDGHLINTDNIDVIALNDGGLDPGPGLRFNILNDEFLLEGDDIFAFLDFSFGFRVTVLDPLLKVKDNSLSLTDASLINPITDASVFILEEIYADITLNDLLGVKDVELSELFGTNFNKSFDSADFAPRDSIYVTKNIALWAESVGEFAQLNSFEQRFSQTTIPEPHAIMLWGVGLLLLVARRHNRK
jgi:hypothetical protein